MRLWILTFVLQKTGFSYMIIVDYGLNARKNFCSEYLLSYESLLYVKDLLDKHQKFMSKL